MPEIVMLPAACEVLYRHMWQYRMFSLARVVTAVMGEDPATQFLFSRPKAQDTVSPGPAAPGSKTWCCIAAHSASSKRRVEVFEQHAPGHAARYFVTTKAGEAPHQARTYAFDVHGVRDVSDNPGEQHMYFRTVGGVLYYGSSLQDDELQRQQEAPWRYRCRWFAFYRPVDGPSIQLQVTKAYSSYAEPAC